MAATEVSNVRIAGVASAVPRGVRTVEDEFAIFGEKEARRIGESIGVRQRHVATPDMCTSDLCQAAAERLLEELKWPRDSVDLLIFVSQTPDYLLPATSCVLHWRLQLANECAGFDLNLGCSGYVYGLWVASRLICGGSLKRALLLVGDTSSRVTSPMDRSVALLFGDAGTATALERAEGSPPLSFSLGTDGSGHGYLAVPAGGFRQPRTEASARRTVRKDGNTRSDEDLYMDGAEIFSFTLREVPPLLKSVLGTAGWNVDEVDAFLMHQANRFMLEYLAKRMRLPSEKVVVALENRGNTSSASIPLAMTDALAGRLRQEPLRLVLAGFGVGFSWAAVALTCGPMVMPELVLVDAPVASTQGEVE